MADLPTGTVSFLFIDIAGSTRLWEQHPQAMAYLSYWQSDHSFAAAL